jgi:ABC-2 type transport system ATP-binding protein
MLAGWPSGVTLPVPLTGTDGVAGPSTTPIFACGTLVLVIRLSGVRKRYRGRGDVLAGIDLDLVPGQPVGVVGGNGTGKSTLLRIVAGCAAPTAGRVSGRPPVVGYLPGQFPASTRMPVRAYLRHLATIHGATTADTAGLLTALAFTGDLDAPVAQLSTGNAQKVGLAQALACGAQLLVLDEPWSGLDATAARALDEHLAAVGRVALLVADHTGRAAGLPGVSMARLHDGVLVPEPVHPARACAQTVIELRCPGDPGAVLRHLPRVTSSWTGPGTLTVRLPADQGDALLSAAIAGGCSVLDVRRERTA